MKYEKCVKIGKKHADRPLLHCKMGTISISNFHRRKMLSSPTGNLAIFKGCADLSDQTQSKQVHWAKPIKREYSFTAPNVNEDAQPQPATMNLATALSLMKNAALKVTPFYCSVCQLYLSSRRHLNRHEGTQKHQLQIIRQSYVVNPQSPVQNEPDMAAVADAAAAPDGETDAIEIVTKPMDISMFYCADCFQQYRSRKQWNRHVKTKKHENSVFVNMLRK